ncbi:DapH/DapD/GlmU-related protein, partial [Clostridioides difficile]|uniref:DapH/DapD/GlmU-related protein n=1 Tax=Clostridioides difficile TaxID=1496 RepID=UPI003F8D49F7
FPKLSSGYEYSALYTKDSNNNMFYEDISSFKGMRVAVLRGNFPVLEPPSATPVIVEDDVLIGANAVILEGVRIGKGAVVAAGAVV